MEVFNKLAIAMVKKLSLIISYFLWGWFVVARNDSESERYERELGRKNMSLINGIVGMVGFSLIFGTVATLILLFLDG